MGAWIEIKKEAKRYVELKSRTPRWVRGLKFTTDTLLWVFRMSHPTMGAWIEIALLSLIVISLQRRTPRWVRGLK